MKNAKAYLVIAVGLGAIVYGLTAKGGAEVAALFIAGGLILFGIGGGLRSRK